MIQDLTELQKLEKAKDYYISWEKNDYFIEMTNSAEYENKQFNSELLLTCSPIIMAIMVVIFGIIL